MLYVAMLQFCFVVGVWREILMWYFTLSGCQTEKTPCFESSTDPEILVLLTLELVHL